MLKKITTSSVASLLIAIQPCRAASEPAVSSHPIPAAIAQQDLFVKWAKSTDGSGIQLLNESQHDKGDEYVLATRIDLPVRADLPVLNREQTRRLARSTNQYYNLFGRNTLESFFWSGIEVSNTLVWNNSYRWNSLKLQEMYDPAKRQAMIASLKKMNIRNIRFGLTNHEIFPKALRNLKPGDKWTLADLKSGWDQESWKPFDDMINDFATAGIRVSLDLHHFGIESFFAEDSQGRFSAIYDSTLGYYLPDNKNYDPTRSFYLNPKWPAYFSEFALEAFKRYHGKIQALTIINEPAITMYFNSQLWNGAFPGWSSPLNLHYDTERAIRIGTAAVMARTKIEEYIQTLPTAERAKARVVYLQSEGIGHNAGNPEEDRTMRFLTLDSILGHDWILKTDFKKLRAMPLDDLAKLGANRENPLMGAITYYIFWGQPDDVSVREKQRDKLFTMLERLQQAHLNLRAKTAQTMEDYTVFGIDYYPQNEMGGTNLSLQPQDYITEVRKGQRNGMYNTALDYWSRYPMPMMVTETGTAYWAYGSQWIQQMLFEAGKFSDNKIPFLGLTVYPAVDTWGWENALSQPFAGAMKNESGLMNLDMQPKPYMAPVLTSLTKVLPK